MIALINWEKEVSARECVEECKIAENLQVKTIKTLSLDHEISVNSMSTSLIRLCLCLTLRLSFSMDWLRPSMSICFWPTLVICLLRFFSSSSTLWSWIPDSPSFQPRPLIQDIFDAQCIRFRIIGTETGICIKYIIQGVHMDAWWLGWSILLSRQLPYLSWIPFHMLLVLL